MVPVTLRLALLLVFLEVAHCALMRGIANIKPGQPGKCLDKETDKTYAVDESWEVQNQCALKTCYEEDGKLYFTVETCGVASAGDGCTVVTDKSKPYPGCCPAVTCRNGNISK